MRVPLKVELEQGGIAKRKLSPLIGVRAFLFVSDAQNSVKGGGPVEGDLAGLCNLLLFCERLCPGQPGPRVQFRTD